MPNQAFYGKIKMDVGKGKRWFCTPEEAEAAGWRRALR
jgi:micrococcal nuclease